MENKSHALAAGLFVLIVSALVVTLAMWLTRDSGSYHAYELSSRQGVSGLQPQAAVRYKGVAVGKVSAKARPFRTGRRDKHKGQEWGVCMVFLKGDLAKERKAARIIPA